MTALLNKLIQGYDKRLRPNFGGNIAIYKTLERVSIECRKTKTKVITLANQKGRRQSSKPIKFRTNYM